MVGLLPPGPAADAAVVVVTDATSRERRERAEREFVMNAAHELRTPLSAIASAIEVLQQGAKEESVDRDRFLAIVERQTNRLTRLVRALLTLAHAQTRSGAIRLEAVAVAPLVRELAAASATRASRSTSAARTLRFAHADLLRQALENLATNALRHAGGQGVDDSRRAHRRRSGKDRCRRPGPGNDEGKRRESSGSLLPCAWSGGEGFGLGLSIAREVVRVMNGTLRSTVNSAKEPPCRSSSSRRETEGNVDEPARAARRRRARHPRARSPMPSSAKVSTSSRSQTGRRRSTWHAPSCSTSSCSTSCCPGSRGSTSAARCAARATCPS